MKVKVESGLERVTKMEKSKYIYLHIKDCCDYEFQDTEDVILNVSTDFKQILDNIDHTKTCYDSKIIISKDDDFDSKSTLCFGDSDVLQHVKSYVPTELLEDREEFDYMYSALEEWVNKRKSYLSEKKKKKEIEDKRREEERDKKEYERLKKKFESN